MILFLKRLLIILAFLLVFAIIFFSQTEKNLINLVNDSLDISSNISESDIVKSDEKISEEDIFSTTILPCDTNSINFFGPIDVDTEPEILENVERNLSLKVHKGGRYKTTECLAKDQVAIIVPYRNRSEHLPILLKNLHPFLMKQKIDYGIFLVEQSQNGSFNRGKLMNIGFVEALKVQDWDCIILHDVDLLPMDDRILYNCAKQPRQMAVAMSTFDFKSPYETFFGGVSAISQKQYQKINGFSNRYFGWGVEDDDFSRRITNQGYEILKYPVEIARYLMLEHVKAYANPIRWEIYEAGVNGSCNSTTDGLNSLKYKLLDLQEKPLYTWILVDVTIDI